MEYLPLYDDRQRTRHNVRPGLTGWAQVNGRNTLSWEQKFELDVWYVENRSLRLDLRIIALTALRVIKGSGVSSAEGTTVAPFRGSSHAPGGESK
jgi:sugar transferase EpsL